VTPDGLPGSLGRAAIAVKSHHTAQAAELHRGRLTHDGYVVSFQNGLNVDVITAVTGPGRLVASFVNFGADVLAPGRIMQGNVATFRVGEPEGGAITPRVAELARALPTPSPPATSWATCGARKPTARCCSRRGVPALDRRHPRDVP
jgi:ketopantoate reductase